MGITRRRQFLVDGRHLIGIADDDLTRAGLVRGEEVLARELARTRTGEMRDIVATIQAEQDVIIRAPLEGVLVVQGGPGTGKTAIGLHRASFLLFEHRARLARQRVLVVGPNRTFLAYISQVLPSLGETAVRQMSIGGLGPQVPVVPATNMEAERIKGDARMADVISRAIAHRVAAPDEDLQLAHEGTRYRLPAAEITGTLTGLVGRSLPYARGREALREDLLRRLYEAWVEPAGLSPATGPWDGFTTATRRSPEFRKALDRMWPALTPVSLVRDLLSKPALLAGAAAGILSTDEREAIRRKRSAPWTPADLALLDEADALLTGSPQKYGHLVVDEAQDLSPMQLRMLARRNPAGSMTVLGDLGQATGAWAHGSWDEVITYLPSPGGATVEELTLGYRVSEPIMDLAARVLAIAAPGVRAPRSVRAEEHHPVFVDTTPAHVAATTVAQAVRLPGAVAVISPTSILAEVAAALRQAGVDHGEAAADGLNHSVTLVEATLCKGLEFDSVVVVEPSRIVAEAAGGLRLLYVALTRAMRRLVVVHSSTLPPGLAA
jgi:DNA helicase IV